MIRPFKIKQLGIDNHLTTQLGDHINGAIDLSSGSLFDIDPGSTGVTDITLTNSPNLGHIEITISIKGYANDSDAFNSNALSPYVLDSSSNYFDMLSFGTPTNSTGLTIDNTGRAFNVSAVYRSYYSFTTPWDVTTLSLNGWGYGGYALATQEIDNGRGILSINRTLNDSSHSQHPIMVDRLMYPYIYGSTQRDIKNTTFDSASQYVFSSDSANNAYCFYVEPKGKHAYVAYVKSSSWTGSKIAHYELADSWDFNTITSNTNKILTASQYAMSIHASDNGNHFYICSFNENVIRKYDMSIPWDITTATEDSGGIITLDQFKNLKPYAFAWSPDGSKLVAYANNDSSAHLFSYDVSTFSKATYNWPSNIDWKYGTPHYEPLKDKHHVIKLKSIDGGATWKETDFTLNVK